MKLFFATQAASFVTCQMTMEINQHGDTSTPFSECYQNAVTGFDRQKHTLMATFNGKPNALALLERYRTAWLNAMQAIEPHENETKSAYEIRQRNLRNAIVKLGDLVAGDLVKDM
jgi:hypothetical protein